MLEVILLAPQGLWCGTTTQIFQFASEFKLFKTNKKSNPILNDENISKNAFL